MLLCAAVVLQAGQGEKLTVRLDDNLSGMRYIYCEPRLSLVLTTDYNTVSGNYHAGFSFYSDRLVIGKVRPSGIWQELFNPFGYSAVSSVYSVETGMKGDSSPGAGGIYGISVILPSGIDLSCMYRSVPWVGMIKEISFSPHFSVMPFFCASRKKEKSDTVWIKDQVYLSSSKSLYAGIELQEVFPPFRLSVLMTMSGNYIFRSGSLFRGIFKMTYPKWYFDMLFVYGDEDFILPSGEPERGKYLVSSVFGMYPLRWFSFSVDDRYRINEKHAYPSCTIERRSEVGVSGQIKTALSVLNIRYTKEFIVNSFCSAGKEYTFQCSLTEGTETLSALVQFVEKGEGGIPVSRKGKVAFHWRNSLFSVSPSFALITERRKGGHFFMEEGFHLAVFMEKATFSLLYRFSPGMEGQHLSLVLNTGMFEREDLHNLRKKRAVSK